MMIYDRKCAIKNYMSGVGIIKRMILVFFLFCLFCHIGSTSMAAEPSQMPYIFSVMGCAKNTVAICKMIKSEKFDKALFLLQKQQLQERDKTHIFLEIWLTGNSDFLKMLVEKGYCKADRKNNMLFTAALLSSSKHFDDLRSVTEEDLEKKDELFGYSLLHWACAGGNVAVVSLLLERAPALLLKTGSMTQDFPVHIAVQFGQVECVKLLLQKDQNILSVQNLTGSTPLHYAVMKRDVGLADFLLRHGANPVTVDSSGNTPVYYAKLTKNTSMIRLLEKYLKKTR